jgi:hypothetical protein
MWLLAWIGTARAQNITAAEYFVDADPGPGNGTAITISSPAATVNFNAAIPTNSLSSGFHLVGIRSRDANGVWGLYESRGFYVSGPAVDAGNIVAAEYFFDTDPGAGKGTAVSVGTSGSIVNFTAAIPTSLGPGFHFLVIRTRNSNGVWGLFETRGFFISSTTADVANIVAAEYFIDTDPGAGNGTATSIGTSGGVVNFTAAIPAPLATGFHFLAIRVKGQDGLWGHYEKRGFYVVSAAVDVTSIASAEYFFDTDPGTGNGTPLAVGTSGAVVNFAAAIPTSLGPGFHFLAIRVKGQGGTWGHYEKRGFYISTAAIDAANIVAAEYFFDSDPGVGNGTPASVGASGAIVNFTAAIPTTLSTGFHILSIRVKGQDGVWGLYEKRGLYVSSSSGNMPIITTAEFFIDADPGIGNGIPLTIASPGDIVTQTFNIPEPGLALGQHFLSIRVKDQGGNWSLYEYDTLNIGVSSITCPGNVIVSAPAGQCSAVVNNIDPVVSPPQAFTYTLSGATTGSGSGSASGQTFNAGVTTVQYVLTGSPTLNCSFTVTVNASVVPSVTVGASSTSICAGTNVTFTATPVNGGATPAYQWKLNGVNVGTNGPTYQNASLSNNDVITVVMTSSIPCASPGTATSNAITMTVNTVVTPSVSINASATTICAGTNVTFTATPVNGGTPSYQWKLNGANVGNNSPTYQNSTLANNDIVSLVMTSSLVCVTQPTATSNSVAMTVNPSLSPSVSISASATTICSGTNVIFTATPTNGGATPAYQWKLNGGNVGANSPSYQNANLSNNDVVTVVMTSSATCAVPLSATSNSITMNVTTTVTPSVNIVASASAICSGTNVTFTATPVNGGTTPSYQWQLNGGNVGTNSPSYQNSTLSNNDAVKVIMTSSLGCVTQAAATSNTVTMTVNATVAPAVSVSANATTICSGTNVIFTANPSNGGATPAYQWKLNGTNVGNNSAAYQNATLANGDAVSVVMTSSLACAIPNTATSNTITMSVTTQVTPAVSIAASATSICAGTNVVFTATPANGGPTPVYQWTLNGSNVGTNSATYQNSGLANNDVVSVTMTSSLTCVTQPGATSNNITMAVTSPITPAVTIVASANTVCAGTNVTFTATPTNGGTPSYQWKLNGGNVGTNGPSYQNNGLANGDIVTVAMTSSLTCVTQSSATSNAITMTVNPLVAPAVSIVASASTICAGSNVNFTATPVNAGTAPAYQWKLNGGNVGGNSPSYQNSTLANGDVVSVVMTSSATCASPLSATSNLITMTVNAPVAPSVAITASAPTICAGTNVTFTANAVNGGGAPAYQWKLNGTNVGTNAPTYQNAALVNNDAVTVVMTSSLSCVTQASATSNAITIAVAPAQTWIGVASSDWNNAANWCGGVPNSSTDVTIPSSAPNMPVLSAAGSARNISINAGGTLTIAANGVLDLFGNVAGAGNFNATAGSINFRGDNSQTIPGFTATNVTMNGAGGLVLNGNSSITGSLTLVNGNIVIGTNNFSLGSGSSGSLASHIITGSTGVVVARSLAAGNTRVIPVAPDAGSYNPVQITGNNGHITDDITIRVTAGVLSNGTGGALLTEAVVNRTWIISESVGGGSDVDLSLQWNAPQELTRFDRNKCYVTLNTNGAWPSSLPTAATGTDPFMQSRSHVTSFGAFAVQTQPIPTPRNGIYPNPARTVLNIVMQLPFAQVATISVYDVAGRKVLEQSAVIGGGLTQTVLNVENLSGGLYYLKITGRDLGELIPTQAFVKE